jgi:hypothetical protein
VLSNDTLLERARGFSTNILSGQSQNKGRPHEAYIHEESGIGAKGASTDNFHPPC